MERYKNLILTLVCLAVSLSSCHRHTTTNTNDAVIPKGAEAVTVIDYSELDGCQFLLELNNGSKLQPVNLDESYRIDGMKLFITYKFSDEMSVCMTGRMVRLLTVTKASAP